MRTVSKIVLAVFLSAYFIIRISFFSRPDDNFLLAFFSSAISFSSLVFLGWAQIIAFRDSLSASYRGYAWIFLVPSAFLILVELFIMLKAKYGAILLSCYTIAGGGIRCNGPIHRFEIHEFSGWLMWLSAIGVLVWLIARSSRRPFLGAMGFIVAAIVAMLISIEFGGMI